MELTSFVAGMLTTALAYTIFRQQPEPELANDDELDHDDMPGRSVTMMCVTCRKQKRHVEIEPDLYQCTRCKRHVDLRR